LDGYIILILSNMRKIFVSSSRFFVSKALIPGLALIVSACGGEPASTEPGQSLVRVNGEEITVIQLNDELSRARVQADQLEQAKKQLLESMIDLQLMVAEAQQNKLDRSPNVMRAIERAKKQIIAQSYMQTTLSQIGNPSDAEINQFYEEYPGLFAQRKKYTLAFLRFPANRMNEDLQKVIQSAKTLSDVAQWLDKQQISYLRDELIRTGTELSPQLNARLEKATKGEMFLMDENATGLFIMIKNIEADPVTLEAIKPQIVAHLLNIKRRETMQAEVSRLRAAANIEYLHVTQDAAVADNAAAEPPAMLPLVGQQDDAAALDNVLLQNESIERGISGLK
jgi:EpsD family peptidyl-prolyl cis-trans isomerase